MSKQLAETPSRYQTPLPAAGTHQRWTAERSDSQDQVGMAAALSASPRLVAQRRLLHRIGANTAQMPLQMKPADINRSFPLKYAAGGALLNAPAARATVSRSALINWKIREGWVLPNQTLIGGHLFKREFGGPDDDTNVVPWQDQAESEFTLFESQYAKAAQSEAATAPIEATVNTNAKFLDRNDLEVSDGELDLAGWTPSASGRDERKMKFHEVADQLSGIPTEVKVSVIGLSGGPLEFSANQSKIQPGYAKNPAALLPGFKAIAPVFQLNPGLPRKLRRVDWTLTRANELKQKLQHEFSHAPDFGVTATWNNPTGQDFENRIADHIGDHSVTTQIVGTYRSTISVIHYVNDSTKLWACTQPDGTLVAAWKLSDSQYTTLSTTGVVK